MDKAIAEKVIEYLGENKKQSNCQRILLEIMLDNSLTEMEIANRLDISQATVSHTIKKFITDPIPSVGAFWRRPFRYM